MAWTIFRFTFLEVAILLFGSLLRLVLSFIVTPDGVRSWVGGSMDSWSSVEEGLALKSAGVGMYEGSIVHTPPLVLYFFQACKTLLNGSPYLTLMAVDLCTCVVLHRLSAAFGRSVLKEQVDNVKNYHVKSAKFLLSIEELRSSRLPLLAAYFLNPFSLVSYLSLSTSSFNNLLVLCTFFCLISGDVPLGSAVCAMATYTSMYPALLFPSLLLSAHKASKSPADFQKVLVKSLLIFAGVLASLLLLSFVIVGDWKFLKSVYWFVLIVEDLTPQFSLSWYFYCEMFDHFRDLFLASFQLNIVALVIPLCLKFSKDPNFLFYVLWVYLSIFKPYCSLAEQGLVVSLLLQHQHLLPFLRNISLILCTLLTTFILAPIMHYLWLYPGSANSNFYFAVTLAHAGALAIFLHTVCFAYLRREFSLKHGPGPHKFSDGTDVKQILVSPAVPEAIKAAAIS